MSQPTILVADDQSDLRRVVRILLTRGTGWQVVEAVDGDEAVALADGHELAAAVLDQRMPGRTGIEVATHMRERGFPGPIVIFSAYLEPNLIAEADRLGLRSVPKGEIATLAEILREELGADAG